MAGDVLSIDLPYPPSLNKLTTWDPRRRRKVPTKAASEYRRRVLQQCMFEKHMNLRLSGPLHVDIKAMMPDRKKRDLDNLRKAAYDALTAAQVWTDDSQVFSDSGKKIYPPVKGGLLRVTITRLHQAT